jgi:Protein of unknown function (DUF4242)
MPTFTVRRDVPGLTSEELDASAFRAIVCAVEYPGMRWLESFWDREAGRLTCIYEAASADEVFDHARRARIPCDEVHEVSVVGPGDFVAPTGAPAERPA